VLLALCAVADGERYYAYVGDLQPDSVLLAWGTVDGVNTIGRSSPSHGEATIKIDRRILMTRQNWLVVSGLKPDTEYSYEIAVKGAAIAKNTFRTWAVKSTRLAFFVIGDYGNGSAAQYEIAGALLDEFTRLSATANPVRFVLTTGDNIYGDISNWLFGIRHTGAEDRDWGPKFFEPYQGVLAHVPFFPTLGNHDGNETERRKDLAAYLDNFFFPGDRQARYYQFNYGGLADFFALDSTMNTESGPARAAYLEGGAQFEWLQSVMPRSTAAWKIPYYHHTMFNAGPHHAPSFGELHHWMDLFSRSGVKVAFNGHEHNFQYSEVNARSGGVRYVTSGAGGELRPGDVSAKHGAQ
jgi:tartrate-resistant acid phosphatase type 5